MIQLEISKGMYGAPPNIIAENKKTSVNQNVRKAVGLMYIRSYIVDFRPNTNQLFIDYNNFKTNFKYETNDRIYKHENGFDEPYMNKIKYFFDTFSDVPTRSNEIEKYILSGAKISREQTMRGIKKMQDLFHDATYINHSDCNEPNWQTTFWDKETFNFLVKMKRELDPNNIFNHLYSIPL